MEDVEGDEGDGEHYHGEDAEDDAWSHLVVGKGEAGEAGQNGGDEKDGVPGAEESAVDEAVEDDEARSDGDEADDDVQDGVRAYAHSKNHGDSSLCWDRFLVLDAAFLMPEKDDVMGISFYTAISCLAATAGRKGAGLRTLDFRSLKTGCICEQTAGPSTALKMTPLINPRLDSLRNSTLIHTGSVVRR